MSWLIVFTSLAQVCALATVLLLTRGLTKEEFGAVSFGLAVQSYLLIFGSAGLPALIIREATQNREQLDKITTSFFTIAGLSSGFAALVIVCVIILAPFSHGERSLLILLVIGNIASSVSLRPLFDVHHQHAKQGGIVFVSEAVAVTVFWWLYSAGNLTLANIGLVYACKWLLLSSVLALVYHRTIRPLRLQFSIQITTQLLRSSWMLLLSGLVMTVPLTFGIIIVRLVNGSADAAILGVAYQVSYAYLIFISLGDRILRPHISGEYGFLRSFIKKLLVFALLFQGGFFFAFLTAGSLAILYILDARYNAAVIPMVILLTGAWSVAMSGIGKMYLIVAHKEKIILRVDTVITILFLIICMLLVPSFSYIGAAIATASAGIFRLCWIFVLVRNLNFDPT